MKLSSLITTLNGILDSRRMTLEDVFEFFNAVLEEVSFQYHIPIDPIPEEVDGDLISDSFDYQGIPDKFQRGILAYGAALKHLAAQELYEQQFQNYSNIHQRAVNAFVEEWNNDMNIPLEWTSVGFSKPEHMKLTITTARVPEEFPRPEELGEVLFAAFYNIYYIATRIRSSTAFTVNQEV